MGSNYTEKYHHGPDVMDMNSVMDDKKITLFRIQGTSTECGVGSDTREG